MDRDRAPRRNQSGRRPRKAGYPSREGPPLSDEERREKQEQRFLESVEKRIKYFLISEDAELDMEPMNSYKRRLVHKIAVDYKLGTESRGEEPERRVCLLRTGETEVPTGRDRPRMVDFGTQTFPVSAGKDGLHLALKMDGSIELWDERATRDVLHDRLVTSAESRIRNSKIVTPDDPDW